MKKDLLLLTTVCLVCPQCFPHSWTCAALEHSKKYLSPLWDHRRPGPAMPLVSRRGSEFPSESGKAPPPHKKTSNFPAFLHPSEIHCVVSAWPLGVYPTQRADAGQALTFSPQGTRFIARLRCALQHWCRGRAVSPSALLLLSTSLNYKKEKADPGQALMIHCFLCLIKHSFA